MTIEQQVFDKWKANEDRLRLFGFKDESGVLTYRYDLKDYGFEIIVSYDKEFRGTVMDHDLEEEYTNFRLETPGKFSSLVKEEFIKCLEKIRDSCCEKVQYRYDQARRINEFVQKKYGAVAEYLWEKYPEFSIYRNPYNKKWYLLNSSVSLNKIDSHSDSAQTVEIINIRIDNGHLEELLRIEGIYRAYHMNKKNWVTITMNDVLDDETVEKLVMESYDIVDKRK
jgi:predicted DNA-binding protein (MmcQ/YjbR family)